MNTLIQTIGKIRQKLPGLRGHALKETPTRTIVIDPLLESLGWDVRDPDEVQLEYPTVDGKSVDYALKLNKKPVLLVEAKSLDDTLDDVKAITQVVGYAANNGIVWCILTNGIKWRVYRSVEKCAAPDKLMFEVNLDPDAAEGITVEQIAKQIWRFSAEEMAKGTLDALGEQTFTDGKVRKALHTLMTNPPRPLLNLVRTVAGDESLAPQRIKESLIRIVGEATSRGISIGFFGPVGAVTSVADPASRSRGARQARAPRRPRRGGSAHDRSQHVSGKPQEVIQLYEAIDRLCMSFAPAEISLRYLAKSINYEYAGRCFCSVHVQQGSLRVWIPLKFTQISNPPSFARDVSNIGHWGRGDVELRISNRSETDEAADLIRRSFDAIKK